MKSQNLISGLLVVLIAFAVVAVVLPNYLKPSRGWSRLNQLELQEKKDAAFSNVTAGGGWGNLKRECESLFLNGSQRIEWRQGNDESQLPPLLKSLRPFYVHGLAETGSVPIVQIKLAGAFSSGGRGHPYYGLYVVCGTPSEKFAPWLIEEDGSMLREFRPVTNGVFEIY